MAQHYVHAIDGRLRIKVPLIKRSAANADWITSALQALDGIRYAKANPTTGNVLVLFDESVIDQERIIARLVEMNCFGSGLMLNPAYRQPLAGRIVETVVQSAVQVALERVILALV